MAEVLTDPATTAFFQASMEPPANRF
jgi:hypothetical protein